MNLPESPASKPLPWNLRNPDQTALVHRRPEREIYRVTSNGVSWAIKTFRSRTFPAIRTRMNTLLNHLNAIGFPGLPGYIPMETSNFFGEFLRRPALLRPWYPLGTIPSTPDAFTALGQQIATLHTPLPAPGLPAIPSTGTDTERTALIHQARFLPDPPTYKELLASIPSFTALPHRLIHNTVSNLNALATPSGEPVLIDWDLAGVGPRIFDLACPLILVFVDSECHPRDSAAHAFYSSYLHRISLEPIEVDHIFPAALLYALNDVFQGDPVMNLDRIRFAVTHRAHLEAWYKNIY
ncbi:phosphotransferase [bacterium]|nr:phosphotransferase [candidate division CSSED10-310 bacterium]